MRKKHNRLITEIIKLWLRLVNKSRYFEYKFQLKEQGVKMRHTEFLEGELTRIRKAIVQKKTLTFKHSGHMGDLIYALPVIKTLAQNAQCELYIQLDQRIGRNYHKHPNGNIMINQRGFLMLKPLLEHQSYLSKVAIYQGESLDIDLDLFRKMPFALDFHSVRWYYHITGVFPSMEEPSIEVEPLPQFADKIVVVRTFRGRMPKINYHFLTQYNNVVFLGTKPEFDDFVLEVPNATFHNVSDFKELAGAIKGCKLYISNQTFAFALAEGLKVKRILEGNPYTPFVFPVGGIGTEVFFQHDFEAKVAEWITSEADLLPVT
jgi:hypothetical protein